MKLSQTRELFSFIKQAGIHQHPEILSQHELEALASNPVYKAHLMQILSSHHYNFYQEMEMDSPYVNTHRDVSYAPELLQLHSHAFYEIIYCESGSIQYLIADKRYRIHSGDVILVPPGVSHRPIFYTEMIEPYSRIVVWISTSFFQNITQICSENILNQLRSREHYLLRTKGTDYKYLQKYFLRGLQESDQKAPLWEISLYGNTASLLSHLSRALISMGGSFPMEKQEDIDPIITYIENHYAERISLESTAKAFHISPSTLGKLFSGKLGISFYHFVTQRRLINSKLKIEQGSSMEEVALSCGFCDYTAFYRAFKKEYGISPREYRQLIM